MVRLFLLMGLFVCSPFVFSIEPSSETQTQTQTEVEMSDEQRLSLTAKALYAKMLETAPHAMYQGIFSHQVGNTIQNIEIVHGVNNGEIWERMMHLDGPVREIIRNGEAMYCIHPDSSVEQLQKQGNALFANKNMGNTQQLDMAYKFKLLGNQRVAGRPVIGIQLTPKDATRHFYQVWLDQQTTVPLRTELIAHNGVVLERYIFSYFQQDKEFTEQRFAPRNQQAKIESAQSQKVLESTPVDVLEWRLNWTPIGFIDQTVNGHAPKLSARRIYSDGVVMFSVYVEGVDKVQDEGTAQSGPTALAVQHKQWQGKTHRITVVGEIPPATAQRIAQSVELR